MGGSVLAVWYALYSDLWSPCWIDGRKPYPFSFREWLLTPYFTCCSRGSLYPPLTGRYLRSTHSSRKSAFPSPIANLLLEQRRAVSRTTHFQSIRPDLPYLDNSHSLIISFTSAISDITYGVQHLILFPRIYWSWSFVQFIFFPFYEVIGPFCALTHMSRAPALKAFGIWSF